MDELSHALMPFYGSRCSFDILVRDPVYPIQGETKEPKAKLEEALTRILRLTWQRLPSRRWLAATWERRNDGAFHDDRTEFGEHGDTVRKMLTSAGNV